MPPIDLNWLAVIAAAVSAFVLGGLWYGPLFGRAWHAAAGLDPAAARPHPAVVFGTAFACSFLTALIFAVFLGPKAGPADGFGAGFVVGVFFVATSYGINYAFAARGVRLWMIDAGYHVLQFCLYGLILGAWH